MSSITSSGASDTPGALESETPINVGANNLETNPSNTVKTQVVPLVYLQTPKLPFATINNSNVTPQLQFTTIAPNVVNKSINITSLSGNQSVLLSNNAKPQQIVLQKTVPKIGAYLTMIKPLTKLEGQAQTNSTIIHTSNTGQKYVIASMPKVSSSQVPTTITTSTVQPTKIAFMPFSIQKPLNDTATNRGKIINLKIADGQLKAEASGITVVNSEATGATKENEAEAAKDEGGDGKNLKPKYAKHGISILKKNYSFGERPQCVNNKLLITPVNLVSDTKLSETNKLSSTQLSSGLLGTPKVSNILINSDTTVKDVVVTKPSTGIEETIILTEPKPVVPKLNRRKSNFACRKDYDEDMLFNEEAKTNFGDLVVEKSDNSDEVKLKDDPRIEIEEVKEALDINMNDDCDLKKLLNWDDGIGMLPGSDLKFIINEFGIIEYVTEEEHRKILEKKIKQANKEKSKDEFKEEMRCRECGIFGLPSEFISPKYCSYDCQESGEQKHWKNRVFKIKKKKKKVTKKSSEGSNDGIKEESEEEALNENSQDRYSYPWACTKKGFSWSKYLDHIKAKAAPLKLFKDAFPYTRNGFRPGMKMEGIDPQHPSYFCVLTVAEVCGYRMRLHFDGYPDNYDFWLNADSMDIFPMGWCEKYGHELHPPPGYTTETFNWLNYLKHTKSTAAPKNLFANRAGNAICPNGFRVGMKLEAVDRKNTSLVCVASVRDMMDNRILVHFDSWDDIYDYWADPTSPYIHPVGWCDQYGHNLTPPNDYRNPSEFTWEWYLKETKSVAAPVRAFKQRPACGFKRGMRLECVDKRVPQLIRVATVEDVKDHQIKIHFDGWLDKYSYWVDDDSSDIHPVGWCQKTGHPIEPPLTPDDVYDFLECPTIGCRGQGHIKGPQYLVHSSQKYCPYADENLHMEKILPDRLLTPDQTLEAVVPVSREPKEKPKPRLGRPPKYPKLEIVKDEEDEEDFDDYIEVKPKRKYKKRRKVEVNGLDEKSAMKFIEDSKITPAEKECWERHSEFLGNYVKTDSDPRTWSNTEVAKFISQLPINLENVDVFIENDIDGEALLSLNQKDIVDILRLKVGPAVKLYSSILLLRKNICRKILSNL